MNKDGNLLRKRREMTGTKCKNFAGDLRAKVALEAIRAIKIVNKIAQEFSKLLKD